MDFAVMLSDERIQAMAKAGLWPDRLITDCLDEAVADCPHKVAVVDHMTAQLLLGLLLEVQSSIATCFRNRCCESVWSNHWSYPESPKNTRLLR